MDSKNLEQLKSQSIARLLWSYSVPAVIGMLVTSLYNIIDRIYIGQGVGPEAIAGLAITFPVSNISAAFGVLIGAGASARTSIMLGAGDMRGAMRVLGNSLVLTLVIGTAYILGLYMYLDDLLMLFGASEVTLPYARDFMVWILPALLLTNICFNLNNVMRASGYPLRAMTTMIIGAVCNIVLAPVFIFSLDMGIKGAAIASDISMAISTLFVLAHFVRRSSTVRFCRGIYTPRLDIIVKIVLIGLAPCIVNFASCAITITVNRAMVALGGDMYVGAVGIFITYTSFIVTFILGMGMGMQPVVGYNYGAGNLHRLRRAYTLTATAATLICVAGCAAGMLCPRLIARVFTSDAALIDITARGLRSAVCMFWVVGFQVISTNFFQSIGKAGKSIVMGLLRQVIFLYPLLRIMPSMMGIDGIWVAFPMSDVLATVVTIFLVLWQFRQINQMQKHIYQPA